MGYYDTAQVCLNGHVINDCVHRSPEFNKRFCPSCGESTITQCPNCKRAIEGDYYVPGIAVIGFSTKKAPEYCSHCGTALPWTEKRIQAAIDLFTEEGTTTAEEARQFSENLRELAKDSPLTPLATSRLKRLLKKVGTGTASAIRDIAVDVLSETARKALFDPQ